MGRPARVAKAKGGCKCAAERELLQAPCCCGVESLAGGSHAQLEPLLVCCDCARAVGGGGLGRQESWWARSSAGSKKKLTLPAPKKQGLSPRARSLLSPHTDTRTSNSTYTTSRPNKATSESPCRSRVHDKAGKKRIKGVKATTTTISHLSIHPRRLTRLRSAKKEATWNRP